MKTILNKILPFMVIILGLTIISCGGSGGGSGGGGTTKGDTTPPIVTMSSPLDGSSNQSRSQTINLEFNKPVQNVNATNVALHKGSVDGNVVAMGTTLN